MAKTYRVLIVEESKVTMNGGNLTVNTIDVAFSDLLRLQKKGGKSEKNADVIVNRAFSNGKLWLNGEDDSPIRCQLGINVTEIKS